MNRRFSSSHRCVQPRLKLVVVVISTALALAVAPAIASALSTAGRGSAVTARSTARGVNPRFAAPFAPWLSLGQPAVASRSRWSIQPTPNPRAPNGQLNFGTCTSASSCVGVGTFVTASKVGATLVERWNGSRWTIQRTPNPAGATVSLFNGVSCSSRSACTAVGDALSASGKETTLVERWNGRTWRIQPTPNPPGSPKSILVGVSCSSSSSCSAVGAYSNRSGRQVNLAEGWNGKRWRIQPIPTPGTGQFAYLNDLACTASSACTAVGAANASQPDQRPVAERWNGHKWSIQRTPNPSQGGGVLGGVACTSPTSCTAVGLSNAGTLAERWNGSSWRIETTPTPPRAQFAFLNSVGCSSRSACTAVGQYGNSSGHRLTLAERWNGHNWTIQHTPSPDAVQGDYLGGVACPSSTTCTAFGISRLSNDNSGTPLTMAQRWNGHSWRLERTPNAAGSRGAQLVGLSCTSSSTCMAVGATTVGTLAERWNGTTWAIEPTPSPARTAASALFGVSCTSRSNCIAVGAAFTAFNGNPVGTLAEGWNGHSWSIQPTTASKSPGALNAVSCTSASDCTAVGGTPSKLLAERWNGASWKTQHVPVPARAHGGFLAGVACTSASSCTAVGIAGFDSSGNPTGTIAERWNGTNWRIQPTPTANGIGDAFNAVSCTSASSCTAVGGTASKLLAERWNGTSWTIQATPTPQSTQQGQGAFFNGVSCPSPSACTAEALALPPSGPYMLAERWNGHKWSIQATPNLPGVYAMDPPAVSCPNSSTCTAVGDYTNNGAKLTLAERWQGSGGKSRPTANLRPQDAAIQARGNQR